MSGWIENIRRVIPYVPGEQPRRTDIIKLNTNENPYPPAPGVRALAQSMDTDVLRLYPDPGAAELTGVLADHYGLKPGSGVCGVWARMTCLPWRF